MPIKPYVFSKGNVPLNLILYGHPGVGKTRFAGQAAELGKVLFLNVEGGMMSVPEYGGNVVVIDIRNQPGQDCLVQMWEVMWTLAARDLKANPWLEGIQTVILDSGSEFATLALEALVAREMKTNPKRRGNSLSDIWLEDYGRLTSELKRMFRHMRDLPYNVITTALVRYGYVDGDDKKRNPNEARPDFTEKLAESSMGFVDDVWYMYRPQPTEANPTPAPAILTQPHGIYRAKTRGTLFPTVLGTVVHNPHFPTILELMRKSESSGATMPDITVPEQSKLAEMPDQRPPVESQEETPEKPQLVIIQYDQEAINAGVSEYAQSDEYPEHQQPAETD